MKLNFTFLSFLFLMVSGMYASTDYPLQPNPNCADLTACNFSTGTDPCEYTSCAGCVDDLACNYDSTKTKSDGSCVFAVGACEACDWLGSANPSDGSGLLVLTDSDGDGICDSEDDCSDTSACNYDSTPTADCVQSVEYYHDEDADGIGDYSLGTFCAGDNIPGSSTTTLANDGSFDLCFDTNACNYGSTSNLICQGDRDNDGLCDGVESTNSDGVKTYSEDLCVDTTKPNYAESANEACCSDSNGNNYCDDREIFGCTDSGACNYFEHANVDDGSCKFDSSSEFPDSNTSQYNQTLEVSLCATCADNDSTVVITETQRINNGLSGTTFTIGRYNANDIDGDDVCDDLEQVGCEDPNACNYGLNVNGDLYSQATDSNNDPMTIDIDGDGVADEQLITESCSYDDALGYGVTPQSIQCSNWCKYDDVCGTCGGNGTDDDGDGVCDDADLCINVSACNYDANPTAACQYLTECDVCASGSDADNDGYIDDNDDDSDDDGLCDSTLDNCFDTTACNYADPANGDCQMTDDCGVCGGSGTDSDGDGLCDDIDNCTDSSKCNYDFADYPTNPSCLEDVNPANGICDDYEITACGDAAACNYDENFTVSDVTLCLYADGLCESCSGGSSDGTGFIVLADADNDGVCDGVDSCEDITACNFNANPTENCGIDSDENGVCDGDEIDGCMDDDACNYMISATREPDGTCVYAIGCQSCSGANDGSGSVVNNDSDFDGICDSQDNCSVTSACNYVAATSNNQACTYADSGKNCSGDCLEDIDLDGICDENDLCTSTAACNYEDSLNEACVYRNTCGDCGESTPGVAGFDVSVYCDCELNEFDVLGNCGGSCDADIDGDGICDDVDPCLIAGEEPDECGVCNGPGAIYECGCFALPEEGCSCETSGTVTYPAQGEDCEGNCLFGTRMEMQQNGVEIEVCAFYDNAVVTSLPTPSVSTLDADGGVVDVTTNPFLLEEWIIKFDTLHSRMSENLDDGSLTGASKRVTIEEHIMDKGDLTVLGESRMSGFVQMDDDVVILGNLVVEQDATIKGTTFSRGGIETTSLIMEGDLTVGGSAVIDSTLEVMQKTLLQDTLTVYGDLLVGRDHVFTVDTFGNTHVNGSMDLFGTLDVADDSRLSTLQAGPTTLSSLTSNGDVVFNTNFDIHGDTDMKGELHVQQDVTIDAKLDVQGASDFTGSLTSTSISNSGQITSGSISNNTSLNTNSLTVQSKTTTQTLEVESNSNFKGNLTVSNGANGDDLFIVTSNDGLGLVNVPGKIEIFESSSDITSSESPTLVLSNDGSIVSENRVTATHFLADSATAINQFYGQLLVGGQTNLMADLSVRSGNDTIFHVVEETQVITLNGPTRVLAATTFSESAPLTLSSGSDLTVGGATDLQAVTATSLDLGASGSITADAATFSGDIAHTGNNLKTSGQLVVGSTTASVPSGHLAYFDGNSAQTSNGIGISVQHSGGMPGNGNNYATFYKANGDVAGRIEGENSSDWADDRGKKLDYDEHVVATANTATTALYKGYQVYVESTKLANEIVAAASNAIPDSWCCAMLIPVGCIIIPFPGWPMPDWANLPGDIASVNGQVKEAQGAAVDLVLATADFVATSAFMGVWDDIKNTEYGVAYATGSGDYAEWMPRENKRTKYHARQIVGVKNGVLSLNTYDFDHLMVISTAPAVLGNSPVEEAKKDYEKVAFLGQVPVDIIGRVNSGDFILPSGDNDGFGIAVDPLNISAEQIKEIVGVAWSNGLSNGVNTINVAVGLANNASSHLVADIEAQMQVLDADMNDVKSYLIQKRDLALNTRETDESKAQSSFETWKTKNQSLKTNEFLRGVNIDSPGSDAKAVENENIEYPQFHNRQQQLTKPEDPQKLFIDSFIENTAEALDGMASMDDIKKLSKVFYQEKGFDPVIALEPSIRSFEKRIEKNLFSVESITEEIRSSVLGSKNYPGLESIQPGTQAELAYVKEIQRLIFENLEEVHRN